MGSNLGMDIDEPSERIEFKQINSELTDNAPAHTSRLQTLIISREAFVAGTLALMVTPLVERIPVQPGLEPAGDYRFRADQFCDKLKLILDEDNGDEYWSTGMTQSLSSTGEGASISSLTTMSTSDVLGAAKGLDIPLTRAVWLPLRCFWNICILIMKIYAEY